MPKFLTEDEVRDNDKHILGFDKFVLYLTVSILMNGVAKM